MEKKPKHDGLFGFVRRLAERSRRDGTQRMDPRHPAFAELRRLTGQQRQQIVRIDMKGADTGNAVLLNGLFKGCSRLRQLDLSALDTGHVTEMGEMFFGCASLKQLDLSTFDFGRVHHMQGMFGECGRLKKVILSDTVLRAKIIPRVRAFEGYTTEQLNDIWRQEYIAAGHELADRAVERAAAIRETTYRICFQDAGQDEIRQYLGLNPTAEMVVVPHRAPKKGSRA